MDSLKYHHNGLELEYLAKNNNGPHTAVVLIHGYGASMADLYDLHQVDQNKNWYFPNGILSLASGMMMSKAWFPIDEQSLQEAMMAGTHRDLSGYSPEGLESAVELLAAFILSLEEESIILGGFSQGAMLSTHLISKLKSKIKAVTLFSGNIVDEVRLVKSLDNFKTRLPVFQSHGEFDPILSFKGAIKLKELLEQRQFPVEFHKFAGQHEIPMTVLQSWAKFMQPL